MWEYDEYGNPYPAEERPDYDYYYNDESGSSQDYHGSFGGHQSSYGSYSDAHNHDHHHHHEHSHSGPHAHHHHGHGGQDDDATSYYTDPSRSRQQDYSSGHVTNERAYEPPVAPVVVPLPPQYSGHDSSGGYDMSAGYELHVPTVTRSANPASTGNRENAPDIFTSDSVVNLTLEEIDALATNRRSRAWLVVLYAPWCRFCQVALKSVHFWLHACTYNISVANCSDDPPARVTSVNWCHAHAHVLQIFLSVDTASLTTLKSVLIFLGNWWYAFKISVAKCSE